MKTEPALQTVPARRVRAVRLEKGRSIRIVNTHGHQVCDIWAFSAEHPYESLSMEHTRPTLEKISRPRAIFLYSKSPPAHPVFRDTTIAACDGYRYGLRGCKDHHANCTDNLVATMRAIHAPLRIEWGAQLSEPGDCVVLRAEMDVVIAMSACPQDLPPINAAKPSKFTTRC